MQKIKKFSYEVGGQADKANSVSFSSNDRGTAYIEIDTDSKYDGLDSVLLVQKWGQGDFRLFTARIAEGKSIFELDTQSLEKTKYTLYYRIYDGDKVVESPNFCYDITEGSEVTSAVLSATDERSIESKIEELLATIRASEDERQALVDTTVDMKKELSAHKGELGKELIDVATDERKQIVAVGTGEVEIIGKAGTDERDGIETLSTAKKKEVDEKGEEKKAEFETVLSESLNHVNILHKEMLSGANTVVEAGKRSINSIVSAGIDSLTLVKESAIELINTSKLGVTEKGEELKTSLNTIFDKAVMEIKEVQKKSEADIVARGGKRRNRSS